MNDSLRCLHGSRDLPSYLIEGFLDLVEVIEVVLHCDADGVHSMRASHPLPGQKLSQVMLFNAIKKKKPLIHTQPGAGGTLHGGYWTTREGDRTNYIRVINILLSIMLIDLDEKYIENRNHTIIMVKTIIVIICRGQTWTL